MKTGLLAVALFLGAFLHPVAAQTVHQELQETVPATVLEIVESVERDIMGTGVTTTVQTLRVELRGGARTGEVVSFENDLTTLAVGDRIFVNRLIAIDGSEYFMFKDVERRPQLAMLLGLLIVLVTLFAGWQGIRALVSLGLSLLAILFILVPALLAGYDPALTSFGIAALLLGGTLFVTHGVKPYVALAYVGTMVAVALTCVLAYVSVAWLRLSGFSADASIYLNFATGGTLDLAGLLLGSIIIGLLGVLDDVAITQTSVVEELRRANPDYSVLELYRHSIKVGRDHVGSLVNTLALAYIGAALPLVLLFARSEATFLMSINQEVIASEIVRIIIGSIGLVLAVPFSSYLAARYYGTRPLEKLSPTSTGHHHHHHHHHGHHHH